MTYPPPNSPEPSSGRPNPASATFGDPAVIPLEQMPRRRPPAIDCTQCPLRRRPLFLPFSDETLAFMRGFKRGEIWIEPGRTLLAEGEGSAHLYTVLSGMGLRYKTLADGARQVVNFVLPGDFCGLQAAVMGEMKHSVIASVPMHLCVFDRSALWEMFRVEPERAFDITWLAAMEEHFLGEALASVGQRGGVERLGWALLRLFRRLEALGLAERGSVPLPYRQQDLADALGLSLVHTNKSLQKLRAADLVRWSAGRLWLPAPQVLADFVGVELEGPPPRPLI